MTLHLVAAAFVGLAQAIACVGFGHLLLKAAGPRDLEGSSGSLGLAVRFALGHLAVGSSVTLLALAGSLSPGLAGAALVSGLPWGLAYLATLGRVAVREGSTRQQGSESPRVGFESFAAVSFVFLLLARSLGPPLNDDALRAYLLTPRVVAESGALAFQPFNPFVLWPLLGEMNTALSLLLGGETAATTFDSAVALAFLAALFGLWRRVGLAAGGASLVLLFFASSSAFIGIAGAGKVDITGGMYGLLAFALAIGDKSLRPAWNLVALFLGAAAAVKYSNLSLFAGLVVLLERPTVRPFRSAVAFCLFLAAPLAPQLLKNALLVGNPTAPFFGDWFGTSDAYWSHSLAGDIGGPSDLTWVHRFVWPFILTFGGHTGMLGTFSPLLLGLLPFAFLGGLEPGPARRMRNAGLLILAAWLIVFPWALLFPRFLFVPAALLAVAAVSSIERWRTVRAVSLSLNASTILCAVLVLFELRSASHSLLYALGQRSRVEVYARQENARPWFALAEFLNRSVRGERVYLEMPYSYFLRLDILQRSQTTAERNAAEESCASRQRVLLEGGFTYFVEPTAEFRWLVLPNRVCPPPVGYRALETTRASILMVREPSGQASVMPGPTGSRGTPRPY